MAQRQKAATRPTSWETQGLLLKEAIDVPAHHQPCSPGKTPKTPTYLTPREAYDLGLRSPPAWHGKLQNLTISIVRASAKKFRKLLQRGHVSLLLLTTDKLEMFFRDDGQRGVKTTQAIPNGSFVCEFEGNLLSRHECEEAEREYEKEGKAVYILEVCYPKHNTNFKALSVLGQGLALVL